jgi:hypothetical protein
LLCESVDGICSASYGQIHAKAKAKTAEGPDMIFFYTCKSNPVVSQIRNLCKLPKSEVASGISMVILNIPDNGGYYVNSSKEVTQESVGNFISGFLNGTLERKQLG